jgi:hypothetical protein
MSCLKGVLYGLQKPCVMEMASGQEAKVDRVLKNYAIKIECQKLTLELFPMQIGGIRYCIRNGLAYGRQGEY